MPIYEFSCGDCGAEFERIQAFSDTSTPACPHCESRQVTRRLGRPAIHFKGSGWYITDSKKSSGEGKSSAIGGTEKNNGGSEKSNGADEKSSAAATKDTAGESAKADAKKSEAAPAAAD